MTRIEDTHSIAEEVIPRPSALIESLRSFGYNPATAVADLIDNSVTAGARRVEVEFHWAGQNSHASILDDGTGMNEATLVNAMRAGSTNPLDTRSSSDLGRFGLGLKTASFSQARSLTVRSKDRDGQTATRRWDLDYVGATDRWNLLKNAPADSEETLARLDHLDHGTLVLWTKLDRLVDDRPSHDAKARNAFLGTVASIREHLEMVFHRMIEEDDLRITVNGQVLEPWDPFLTKHPKTELLPKEDRSLTLPGGGVESLRIQPYVLPHRSELTSEEHRRAAGPKGWNLQQGFYLYRAKRLIMSGDWFNPNIKPEEHHKLARIRVEFSQSMDPMWNLDVRKSRARPPAILRDDFTRIARATRERAEAVYRHRGRRSVGQNPRRKITPVWFVEKLGDQVHYQINRQHALISHVMHGMKPHEVRQMQGALSLIESNVPIAHILSTGFEDEQQLPFDTEELGEEIQQVLRSLFCDLIDQGHSNTEAKNLLLGSQPFDRYSEVIEAISEGECS